MRSHNWIFFKKADIQISDIFHIWLNADKGLCEVAEGRANHTRPWVWIRGGWAFSLGLEAWGLAGDRRKGALQKVHLEWHVGRSTILRHGPAVRQPENRDKRPLGRRGMEGTTVAAKGMIRLMSDQLAGRKLGKSRRWLPKLEPEQWENSVLNGGVRKQAHLGWERY